MIQMNDVIKPIIVIFRRAAYKREVFVTQNQSEMKRYEPSSGLGLHATTRGGRSELGTAGSNAYDAVSDLQRGNGRERELPPARVRRVQQSGQYANRETGNWWERARGGEARYDRGSYQLRQQNGRSNVSGGSLRVRREAGTRQAYGSYGTGPASHWWRERKFYPPRRVRYSDSESESSSGSEGCSTQESTTDMETSDDDVGMGSDRIRERPLGSGGRNAEGEVLGSSQADSAAAVVRWVRRAASVDLAGVQRAIELRRHAGLAGRSPASATDKGELCSGDVHGSSGDEHRDAGNVLAGDTGQVGDQQESKQVPALQQAMEANRTGDDETSASKPDN